MPVVVPLSVTCWGLESLTDWTESYGKSLGSLRNGDAQKRVDGWAVIYELQPITETHWETRCNILPTVYSPQMCRTHSVAVCPHTFTAVACTWTAAYTGHCPSYACVQGRDDGSSGHRWAVSSLTVMMTHVWPTRREHGWPWKGHLGSVLRHSTAWPPCPPRFHVLLMT